MTDRAGPTPASTGAKSDINVTPLIDVMLVLLIIFMVVTPLAQKGLDVALPHPGPGADRAAAPLDLSAVYASWVKARPDFSRILLHSIVQPRPAEGQRRASA